MSTTKPAKPLGKRAYGSIPHVPGSKAGEGEHYIDVGMWRLLAGRRPRRPNDWICCEEKLDGSNVAVAKLGGELHALIRAGYRAVDSPREMHHLFAAWVQSQRDRFDALLQDGERVCGEWLAQAHGTIYELHHEPFVAFDLMRGDVRALRSGFWPRERRQGFTHPRIVFVGEPLGFDQVRERLAYSGHGAAGPAEGCVWRLENGESVEFLAKWVRPDHTPGRYLPEVSGEEAVWNWRAK